jgi:hypothetical protein
MNALKGGHHMKVRNIAITVGLLASLNALANTGAGTGATSGSAAATGSSGTSNNAADVTTNNSATEGTRMNPADPADGTTMGSPQGGTAGSVGGTGSSISGSTTGSSTTDMGATGSFSSRQSIMDAQQALVNQGFSISVDGRSGPQTRSAIRQFQARNGLPETGVLDTRTQEMLRSNSGSQPSASDTSVE